MRRLSLDKRGNVDDKHVQRESKMLYSLSCVGAINESSSAEIFTVIACISCILITFSIAFFLPEIATSWDLSISNYVADDTRTSSASGYDRRYRNVNWRNTTGSACSVECFKKGHGNIFLQPFTLSYEIGKKNHWKLANVLKRAVCDADEGKDVKKPKRSSLFLGSLNKPFDTRFLDHNGLILIAEMKIPNYDTILLQSKSKKQKTKSHSIRNSLNQLQQNYNTRVLANVRSQHNEFSKTTLRFAKRVLSSFDLVLLGEWERDAYQRRRLFNILYGKTVKSRSQQESDEIIAQRLGFENIHEPVVHLSTDRSNEAVKEGELRGGLRQELSRDIDVMLFNHALNMTGSGTNRDITPGCNTHVTSTFCSLMKSSNIPRYMSASRECSIKS